MNAIKKHKNKKQIFYTVLICTFAVAFLVSCNGSKAEETKNESYYTGELYVNGNIVSDSDVTFITVNDEFFCVRVSFVSVLEAFGFLVQWTDEQTATVSKDSKSYTLSLTDKTLIENNPEYPYNLILTAPGCDHGFVQATEKDLVMNHENIGSTLQMMGITVRNVVNSDYTSIHFEYFNSEK